jgi:arylsulfatase A-like enzyme
MRIRALFAAVAVTSIALVGVAQARPESADKDGRPNILVVMTDDMALSELKNMPSVQKLLVKKGTSFTNAIDSFPLCCPARATFITGQYAHNHGVAGNFAPYGWYGMKHRKNILPAWLDKAGYETALIGKWLNGYGAKDAHGEIPNGFDIWRGLLDASAYDYFNFVMNVDGKLRTWGDAAFAMGLVKFAKIEVTPGNYTINDIFAKLEEEFGPRPYHYWGTQVTKNYSPDVTGKITEGIVKDQAKSKQPFFVWWSPASPHREDVATTLMGRPGMDPRPAPRYENKVKQYTLPRPPDFNEADTTDKSANFQDKAPLLTDEQIQQLQLDYEGRAGSILAVDDHVKKLVKVLKQTDQYDNTVIIFVSDNGWLQGEHRIPGDKFLPYEESVKVPLVIAGPGVPKHQVIRGQVGNIDFAPTIVDLADATAKRTMDGVSLLPTIRNPKKIPNRAIELEALSPLFLGDIPVNGWDRPYTGVRTDRYTYVVWTETGEKELYDRKTDPYEMTSVAGDPAYADIESHLAAKLVKLNDCAGAKQCNVKP